MDKTKFHQCRPGHQEWLGFLARVYQGRIEVANLIGLRTVEEQSIALLTKLGSALRDPGLDLEIAKYQTRFHLDRGNLSQALESVSQLTAIAEKIGSEEIARALIWQALIHRERSEHVRAIQLYSQAEALLKDRMLLAEVWQDKGLTYTYLGQYDQAETLLVRALDFFRTLGSPEKTATACNDLGICYYQQHQYRKALDLFEEAIGLYLRIGYKLGSATAAGNLVQIYLYSGDIGRALDLAGKCLEWGQEIEDRITMGLGHEQLGNIYQALGMPERALEHLAKAEECAIASEDFMVRGLVLGLMAEVLAGMGRLSEAEAALKKAEDIGGETGEEILIYRIETKRAWLTWLLDDPPQALERWDLLIRKAESRNDQKSADEARLKKASCLLGMGDMALAKRCFQEIAPNDVFSVFWHLNYRALGVEIGRATGDHRMAEENGLQAVKIAEQLTEKNPDRWIRERLLASDPFRKLTSLGCVWSGQSLGCETSG